MSIPGSANSADLTALLAEWPGNEADELVARRVTGPGGQVRLQVRLNLGLIEMHPDGRPDGWRPNGHLTLLDELARRFVPEADDRSLSREECAALQREAMQFYHRRLAFLRLGEFAAAAADAEHNLAIMDLLRDHAEDRRDWLASEQYRVFVLTHWARAKMLSALEAQDPPGALAALDEGIRRIEQVLREEYQQPEWVDHSEDLQSLRRLREALADNEIRLELDGSLDLLQLEAQLAAAIANEDYERAARLRDLLTAQRETAER